VEVRVNRVGVLVAGAGMLVDHRRACDDLRGEVVVEALKEAMGAAAVRSGTSTDT
jgi:hypothetical protein